MSVYHEDIVDIELENGTIFRNFLNHSIGSGDNNANRFGVRVYRDGEEVDLTGIACQGYFRDPHGNYILISGGTTDGNVAYITLPQACYNYDGQFVLAIKLIGDGVTGTVRIVDGVVDNTNSDNPVVPTESVPTYQEIIAQYDLMVEATEEAEQLVQTAINEAVEASLEATASAVSAVKAELEEEISSAVAAAETELEGEISSAVAAAKTELEDEMDSAVAAAKTELEGEIKDSNGRSYKIEGSVYGSENILTTERPYIINTNGIWSQQTARHVFYPVANGDQIVVAASDVATVIAFLTGDNDKEGTAAEFSATYPARIVLTANQTVSYTAPADCKFLYAATANNTGDRIAPKEILVNGLSIISSPKSEIVRVEEKTDKAQAEALGMQMHLGVEGMRRSLPGEYSAVELPALSHMSGISGELMTDGYKFVHTFDLRKNKNVSSKTTYVSTQDELETAITGANSGETIVLLEGGYKSVTIEKSINLIGRGNVVITQYEWGGFAETQMENVYSSVNTFETAPDVVYDISRMDEGIILPLKRSTSSTSELETPGTFRIMTGKLYVHLYNSQRPKDTDVAGISNSDAAVIKVNNPSVNATIYLENLKVFGGYYNVYVKNNASNRIQKLFAVDCSFMFSQDSDAIHLMGANGYFQRCICAYAFRDGFNYHKNSETTQDLSNGLEIDCIGHDCGNRETGLTEPSNNGSTIHDGGKIVRINGLYYNNNGGNVADINSGTISYNYGCVAFDSKAIENDLYTSADFWVRKSAQMYLYGCRGVGDSINNLYAGDENAFIRYHNTEFVRKSGDVEEI